MPDDKEISNLDPLEVMASDDLFVVVSSGATKKIEKNKAATSIKLDDLGTPDDNTDLNATTSKHGLLKKLDNNSSKFMNGQGSWAVPPASAEEKVKLVFAFDAHVPPSFPGD
ncbi:hypothetical protein LCGC14_1544240 [marine sediment metagenome]|uniref:Uncharacterized protein n=1 Tax=marine sediment metagenome TaxID=412755 RepID=A0A0F9IS74_9ZZZZ